MGQKLVSIKFNTGSSPDLWNSETVQLQVQVSPDKVTWETVTTYCPELTKMTGLPVELQNSAALTNSIIKTLVSTNQKIVTKVDDGVSWWQVQFSDTFLTEGQTKVLASGSF